MPITYLFSGLFIGFYPKWLDTRVMLIVAAFLNFVAISLVGPSKVLGFPDTVVLIGIG